MVRDQAEPVQTQPHMPQVVPSVVVVLLEEVDVTHSSWQHSQLCCEFSLGSQPPQPDEPGQEAHAAPVATSTHTQFAPLYRS